ncbi:MAG TPA: hypothetical protein VFU06_05155 [Longimicrobiales bacterium]|nr:hypothetical protein [Longimicrobiales bacterium]
MKTPATRELFAVAAPGLEAIVAAELRTLGIEGRVEQGGVAWSGDDASLSRAVLHLRTASRVLVRVARFRARGFPELERHAGRVDWSGFVARSDAVALRVTSRKSRLYHEGAIAERLLRVMGAAAVPVDEEDASAHVQQFVVRFLRDECVISADAAGPLHRRGYRQQVGKAPLRETLAAAMLHAIGCTDVPLLDPMCGSGTIVIEAALLARRIPPALANDGQRPRASRMLRWSDFDHAAWDAAVADARRAMLAHVPVPVIGSDRDAGAIAAARANAERAGVQDDIAFEQRAISDARVPEGVGALVTNPPYGVRVGDTGELRDLYAALGNLARRRLPGWQVAVLCADRRLCAQMRLPLQPAFATRNGGLAVELMQGRVPASSSREPPLE